MRKTITFLFLLVAFVTLNAQTPISVPNGDFSTGNVLLSTGTNPYTVISGWTVNAATSNGVTNLTPASSGVVSGEFYLKGTASGAAGDVLVTSYPNNDSKQGIDISAIPVGATFTFNCPMKAAGTQNGTPHNLAIKLYDINGLDVTTACTSTSSKSVVAINTSTYTNETAVLVTQANNIGGNNAYYIAIVMQLGKNLLAGVYVDNVTLNYTTNPPILSVGTPTGTALSYEVANGPSAAQSFTVSGTNLTANLFVTPGANIELSSTSGSSGFQGGGVTLSLTPSSGTVATTTIYARLVSGLSLGTGGTNAARLVTIATTGTTSQTIQYAATVNGITSSVAGGAEISYAYGAGPSAEKTLTIAGAGLTANVLVTPGANMEISTTSGTGFASAPITLTQVSNAVAATPIYARLIAGLAVATYNDATTLVTASSTDLTSKEVQFVGTVDVSTGIANNNISGLKIIAANNSINVIGVETGKQIDIYNSVGQKIKSVTATANNNITLSAKGIYLVKVDATVQKVILK
jgi:hypothetical protein